jgi:hypothetical protein
MNNVRDKYCKKRNDLLSCTEKFIDKMEPCLMKEEINAKQGVLIVMTATLEFLCSQHFAIFPKLLSDKTNEVCANTSMNNLNGCLRSHLGKHFDEEPRIIWTISKLLTTRTYCQDIDNFTNCTVTVLTKCENPMLKNLAERFLATIKKESICANIYNSKKKKTTAKPNKIISQTKFNETHTIIVEEDRVTGLNVTSIFNVNIMKERIGKSSDDEIDYYDFTLEPSSGCGAMMNKKYLLALFVWLVLLCLSRKCSNTNNA